MTTHDLFRCIGDLSDEFIEEAAEIRRKSRWLPIAALAACAVLAISIPLVLHGGQKSASTAADSSAAVECPAEDASLGESETTADAPAAGAEGESDGSRYDSDPTAARILATEIGGLRLGMTQEEVASLLGAPVSFSNSGDVERVDGLQEICWFYNTSGSTDVLYDAALMLVGDDVRDGPDAVVSSIWISSPCTWTLDTGIGIGSPQETVDAAYPDAVWTHETMIENDQEIPYDLYELTSGDLFMLIRVEAGEVSHISFGGLNAEHFWDEAEPAPTDPYTFTPYDTLSGGTVTAYTRTEDGWAQQVLTEKRAKLLVIALNIMDPEPGDVQGEPVIWLEFESGGVAALYDESGAGAIYLLENQTAFETALSSGEDPTSALTLIEYCTFPGVWDNVMSALDA